LKNGKSKSVTTFNGHFHKSYLENMESVRPSNIVSISFYVVAHDSHFSLFVREKQSPNLDAMLDNDLELENNMVVSENGLIASYSQYLKNSEGGKRSNVALYIYNHRGSYS
jgi:hypothetical protein